MTLDQYVSAEIALLNKFKETYKEKQAENPLDFPSTMDEGEWLEQFLSLISTYD
mgnify:CR=1 FL=1